MVSIHHYGHGSLKADSVMLLKKGLNQEGIVGLGKNWNGKTMAHLDMIQLCFLGDCRIVAEVQISNFHNSMVSPNLDCW